MANISEIYAALMGDIVRSEQQDMIALHAQFNAAIDRQNEGRGEQIISPLTITLGDEFQGLAKSLADGFSIIRDIRLDLLDQGVECRFALGKIALKTPLNMKNAWNMMGLGLAETRDRLNEKRTNTLYRFVFPDQPVLETMLEASGASLTAIERGWTETQRRDIRAMLEGESVNEVAQRRNVSVHSVYKVRGSGNFDLYLIHWNAIQEALTALDKLYAPQGMPI